MVQIQEMNLDYCPTLSLRGFCFNSDTEVPLEGKSVGLSTVDRVHQC